MERPDGPPAGLRIVDLLDQQSETFGVGLLGTLALALARYDAAVGLGIFLLAAVRIEPAPADLILFVVIAVAFVTGRFYIRRVPLAVTVLLSVFLALNMLASVELIDGYGLREYTLLVTP